MNSFNSALGKNITFVRPAYFIISGFSGIPNIKYYYVFLCFVYIVSVLGNTVVMAVIYLDHNLRTPKYVAVFNLAFVDLLGSLTLLFFCYTFLSMQVFNLIALSYDRLIAIMDPLHYHVKVTHRFMLSLIASFWVFVVIAVLILVGLLTRLSFCRSVVINSYFCDHSKMFRLACNDYTPSFVFGVFLIALFIVFPLAFIVLSYVCIGYALSKVATAQERYKAFRTCTAHLSLVAIYFIPIIIAFSIESSGIHPNVRIINLSLTSFFPPMLNPIIYVLQTQEIQVSVKKILKVRIQSKVKVRKVIIK